MASRKNHLFTLQAISCESWNPGDYYINPSEKLMTKTSDWSVVEHEDYIETIFNMAAFKAGDCSYILNSDFIDFKGKDGEFKDGLHKMYFPKIKVEDNKKKIKVEDHKKKNNVVGSTSG
ncbi:hypothetical protein C5167_024249 [Papaver somniferum]|uniref:Uncharacterized protein n=1 Tax=Papaver somniferum TaxID=3469 RepID=A0A4Y7JQZ7_PAPSO|nr:hypothetical protein C5167_024249 [Papaver somniferum]